MKMYLSLVQDLFMLMPTPLSSQAGVGKRAVTDCHPGYDLFDFPSVSITCFFFMTTKNEFKQSIKPGILSII